MNWFMSESINLAQGGTGMHNRLSAQWSYTENTNLISKTTQLLYIDSGEQSEQVSATKWFDIKCGLFQLLSHQ